MGTATNSSRKINRSIGLIEQAGIWFLLEITAGKKTDYYLAREIPTDFGRGFQLEKQALDTEEPAAVYFVNIGGLDGYSLCDCPGFTSSKRGGCKHSQGLEALLAVGKLPPLGIVTARQDIYGIAG